MNKKLFLTLALLSASALSLQGNERQLKELSLEQQKELAYFQDRIDVLNNEDYEGLRNLFKKEEAARIISIQLSHLEPSEYPAGLTEDMFTEDMFTEEGKEFIAHLVESSVEELKNDPKARQEYLEDLIKARDSYFN